MDPVRRVRLCLIRGEGPKPAVPLVIAHTARRESDGLIRPPRTLSIRVRENIQPGRRLIRSQVRRSASGFTSCQEASLERRSDALAQLATKNENSH